MRRLLLIILSILMISFTGCGKSNNNEKTNEVVTTSAETSTAPTTKATEKMTVEPTETSTDTPTSTTVPTEMVTVAPTQPVTKEPTSSPTPVPTQVQTQEPTQKPTQVPTQKPTQQVTEAPTPAPTQAQSDFVAYSPDKVVKLATQKTKDKVKTYIPDDMKKRLREGTITQAEYDEYYPYAGAGYYSVFVETNLNEASDITGWKLGTVDGIAEYIAGMLALETGPYFYIEYSGTTNLDGTDFYEFRCYRA